MSTANDPGFMDRPGAANPTTSPKTLEELTSEPATKPDPTYHWAFELPASVKDSYHWAGSDADLHFGVIEPTVTDLQKIGRDPNKMIRDIAVSYIRALGKPREDGSVERDADGDPVLRPVGYQEVERWFGRIGPKAVQLVVGEWQGLFNPSEAEGNSMRASRRRG